MRAVNASAKATEWGKLFFGNSRQHLMYRTCTLNTYTKPSHPHSKSNILRRPSEKGEKESFRFSRVKCRLGALAEGPETKNECVYAESMFMENSIYKLIYWGFEFYYIVLVIVVQRRWFYANSDLPSFRSMIPFEAHIFPAASSSLDIHRHRLFIHRKKKILFPFEPDIRED